MEALFGWLRHSLDGPVKRKSVLSLSIFVESYQFVWNGFALIVWVNRLHIQMDAVSQKGKMALPFTQSNGSSALPVLNSSISEDVFL